MPDLRNKLRVNGVAERMAYRDFEGALAEQRRALIDELEHLDAERALLQKNLRRRAELSARLQELDNLIGASASQPNTGPSRRSLLGWARKHWLPLVAALLAVGPAAAVAFIASPANVDEPSRSLCLMVKYVDRIGTDIQRSAGPAYDRSLTGYPGH
jgi:hypothetical protein